MRQMVWMSGVLLAVGLACGGVGPSDRSTVEAPVGREQPAVPAAAPAAGRDCYLEDVACKRRCEDSWQTCQSPCDDGISGPCISACNDIHDACDRRCDEDRWRCEG